MFVPVYIQGSYEPEYILMLVQSYTVINGFFHWKWLEWISNVKGP